MNYFNIKWIIWNELLITPAVYCFGGRLNGDTVERTGESEHMPCDMLVRSCGYVGERIDETLPYVENTGGSCAMLWMLLQSCKLYWFVEVDSKLLWLFKPDVWYTILKERFTCVLAYLFHYEWAKRTKFLLAVIYGSACRHSIGSKTFKKNWKNVR